MWPPATAAKSSRLQEYIFRHFEARLKVRGVSLFQWWPDVMFVQIGVNQYRIKDWVQGGSDNGVLEVIMFHGDQAATVHLVPEDDGERRFTKGMLLCQANRKNSMDLFLIRDRIRDPKFLTEYPKRTRARRGVE